MSNRNSIHSQTIETVQRKLLVLGDGNCGKTCMLISYVTDIFSSEYVPTIFQTFVAELDINTTRVELSLWDTAGQEDYCRLRPLSYPDTDVILLCFAIDSPSSFANISLDWLDEIVHFCPNVPFILVGNKIDLRDDPNTPNQITAATATDLARLIKADSYMECSAKTRVGIKEVFTKAAELTLIQKKVHRRFCTLL